MLKLTADKVKKIQFGEQPIKKNKKQTNEDKENAKKIKQ
jgi:hypothetical protein